MSRTSCPLPSTRSARRDPDVSERAAAALLAELKHPSLLVRHIALCRLLHGGMYREFTPEALPSVATHLSVAADHDAGAVRLLRRIATLQGAERETARAQGSVATDSVTNGVPGLTVGDDSVRVLFAAAVAELGEHGYRTVCGRQSVSPNSPLTAAASSLPIDGRVLSDHARGLGPALHCSCGLVRAGPQSCPAFWALCDQVRLTDCAHRPSPPFESWHCWRRPTRGGGLRDEIHAAARGALEPAIDSRETACSLAHRLTSKSARLRSAASGTEVAAVSRQVRLARRRPVRIGPTHTFYMPSRPGASHGASPGGPSTLTAAQAASNITHENTMNTIRQNEHLDMPTGEVWHYVGETLKFLRTDVASESMFDVEVGAVVLLQQMNTLRARDALSTQPMTEASLDAVNRAVDRVRSLMAQRGSYADIQWGLAEVLVALVHAKANADKARMAEVIEEAVMGHLKGIAMRRTQVGTSRQPIAPK